MSGHKQKGRVGISSGEQTMAARIASVEKILGYHFQDASLIEAAITHPSAVEDGDARYSYERLEFYGDSLVGAMVAAEVFHRFPSFDEGFLTRLKVSVVSGETLSRVARELGFGDIVVFGSSEKVSGNRGMKHALENVYEAVVAALRIDGGIELARSFVLRTLGPHIHEDQAWAPTNSKSILQELLQVDHRHPHYRLVETEGPPHDCTFTVEVCIDDEPLAQGRGRSKKEAETQAASEAIKLIYGDTDLVEND